MLKTAEKINHIMIGFMLMNLNFESLLLLTSLTIHDPFRKRMKSEARVKIKIIPIIDCNAMIFTMNPFPPSELINFIDQLKHEQILDDNRIVEVKVSAQLLWTALFLRLWTYQEGIFVD
jgi:hypothetical protein